jgi:NAD(P)-dependent dehydrogenase (short-subunit alcohol dehydrogenase family)
MRKGHPLARLTSLLIFPLSKKGGCFMKTWFITGASGGLAYPMVESLLERGDRVAATVRKPGALNELQEKYGSRLWQATMDLTEPDSITKVVNRAFEELGTIDILINNAAYGLYGAVEEASDEQIVDLFQTNVFGSLRVARAFMPFLRAQGSGHIVQVSSSVGQATGPGVGLYSASKWAVEAAFEALAKEAAPFNIKVTLAEPGGIRGTGFLIKKGVFGQELPAYDDHPARGMRRLAEIADENLGYGDPQKMAKVIIRRVDEGNGPLRMALGSDAYQSIEEALTSRLATLEAQKELAYSTDFDDVVHNS